MDDKSNKDTKITVPPPSLFKIFLLDLNSIPTGIAIVLLIWSISWGIFFSLSIDLERYQGNFYQELFLSSLLPLAGAIAILLWRIPAQIRRVRRLWQKGEQIPGQVVRVFNPRPPLPPSVTYIYLYNNKQYTAKSWIPRKRRMPRSKTLNLIVNPDKPTETLITDFYR